MGQHSAPDVTVQDVDLSDEAVWIYDDLLPDLLEDGKLNAANAGHAKKVGLSLAEGLALTVALTAGPAVWSEIQGGNLDVPSLLMVAYTYGVAAAGSYLRKLKK
ncbi:hypothetical protein AB0C87_24920 [Actinomadura sp. NPDC048021]|uniref:hypothetical protein n=1 Tax=Actinomadura sp. NPDC048021 TaxID=3155385 RepID=UPI0033F0A386